MKCELCGHDVERLFPVLECNMDLCPSCYEGIEGEPPDTRDELPPLEGVTIRMDARMLRTLEGQADVEGFSSVECYLHTIIFRVAVTTWLEDLAEPETEEEQAAFTREMKDWLKYR